MKELSIIQTDNVAGGVAWVPDVFIGWADGHVLDNLVESYHDYWKNAVDSGWGVTLVLRHQTWALALFRH